MEAKEFDSTANTRMSSEQSQVARPEAAVGKPPPAALNGAATAFAPTAAPGVVIAAADVSDTVLAPASVPTPEGAVTAATDEVTSTAAAASAPHKTKDEQSDKEEVPGAVASVAAAAGVATAEIGSAHSMDGGRCDMELASSTPQPAAGAEGVEMFTTLMQQLPVDNTRLPISQDNLNNLGGRLMNRMHQGEQQQAFDLEQRMLSFLTRYADQQDRKQVELLQSLDKRAEAYWTQVNENVIVRIDTAQQETESLRVCIDTAQQETGKRIEDLAGQASVLSKRLDNNQAERILKTKETNVEQENKVNRQLETVAEGTFSKR